MFTLAGPSSFCLSCAVSLLFLLGLCNRLLHVCVNKLLWLPHCPLPVGDHFVTVAVGDQMANWALRHVTSLHRGVSQSAQARLLGRRPHRHQGPNVTASSFTGPLGTLRSAHTDRNLPRLILHLTTGLFTFWQPEWLRKYVFVCSTRFAAVSERKLVSNSTYLWWCYWQTNSQLHYRCC